MREFVLQRGKPDADRTMGEWRYNGALWYYTIEPGDGPADAEHPRIPAGHYVAFPFEWQPGSTADFPRTWQLEGPGLHRPRKRTAILVHWGNLDENTKGCIVIGLSRGTLKGEPAVLDSKAAVVDLRKRVGRAEFGIDIREAA